MSLKGVNDDPAARIFGLPLNHFVNATVFNGYARESVSSHTCRVREEKRRARVVIRLTDRLQKDHCMRANKREQAVVDLVVKAKLGKQTIF